MSARLRHWIAVCGGLGYVPGAPGTAGALAGLAIAVGSVWLGGTALLGLVCLGVTVTGWWAASGAAQGFGVHDPAEIVIDEVAGQILCCWTAWVLFPPGPEAGLADPLWWLACFAGFRLLDIAKPWPISWIDRKVAGGAGIMLDDLVAALAGGGLIAAATWIALPLLTG